MKLSRKKLTEIVFVCSSDGPNVEETEVSNSKSNVLYCYLVVHC